MTYRYAFVQVIHPVAHFKPGSSQKDGLFQASEGYTLEREENGNTVVVTHRSAPDNVHHLPWESVSDAALLPVAKAPAVKAAAR